jgi:hypothetical protein
MSRATGRKSLLFLKKKKQKNFYPFGAGSTDGRVPCDKSFFASFFSKKEDSAFLPLALLPAAQGPAT